MVYNIGINYYFRICQGKHPSKSRPSTLVPRSGIKLRDDPLKIFSDTVEHNVSTLCWHRHRNVFTDVSLFIQKDKFYYFISSWWRLDICQNIFNDRCALMITWCPGNRQVLSRKMSRLAAKQKYFWLSGILSESRYSALVLWKGLLKICTTLRWIVTDYRFFKKVLCYQSNLSGERRLCPLACPHFPHLHTFTKISCKQKLHHSRGLISDQEKVHRSQGIW